MATAIPPKNTLLLGVVAIGALWFFTQQRQRAAMAGRYQPGATPVMGSYLQSPNYAARGIQAQQASMSPWQQLGSALGGFVNKITGGDTSPTVAANGAVVSGGSGVVYPPMPDFGTDYDNNPSNPAPGMIQFTQTPNDLANWYG